MTRIRRLPEGLSDDAVKAISFLLCVVAAKRPRQSFGTPGHVAGHSIEDGESVVVKTARCR